VRGKFVRIATAVTAIEAFKVVLALLAEVEAQGVLVGGKAALLQDFFKVVRIFLQ
jgi:hypothetical protein